VQSLCGVPYACISIQARVAHNFVAGLIASCAAVQIKNYARVADSIVGWGSRLGTWSRLENHSVIGEDVFVRDEVLLNGAIVLPHKVRTSLFTNANM
jgi:NDP-sugar pyrophosphorylase family protein